MPPLSFVFLVLITYKPPIALTKSTQLDPVNAEAWNQLCIAQRRRGNYEQAILSAQKAVQLQPEWSGAWGNLAHCLTSLGRHAEAEQAKRRLFDLRAKESKIVRTL